jgi:DNA (cytosine-5)-methyltransferase 1
VRYLSVCSGIEAATVAWHPLGWEAAAYSEIEKFPSQVLAHHYPNTPNVGDMTKFKEWTNVSDVDVLVGGTPCQSFSVAGLRKGLDDPRGNLMLTYLAIAAKYRPKWLVWENVPGVLSSNGGLDFASLLRGMGELGYGFAYRVLDAQYFGVAQRRRRVFVVGYAGNWRPAAAVLFERHSMCGYPAPSREKGKGAAASTRASAANSSWPAEISSTLDTTFGTKQGLEDQHVNAGCPMFVPSTIQTLRTRRPGEGGMSADHEHLVPVISPSLNTCSGSHHAPDTKAYVVQPAYGIPSNWIGRKPENGGNATEPMHDIAPCLTKADQHGVAQPITFSGQMSNPQTDVDIMQTLQAKNPMAVCLGGQHPNAGIGIDQSPTLTNAMGAGGGHIPITNAMQVRRLSPKECERLQGFPDNYTDIKLKGKPTPDGPRYKALGNSMAVPVMAWIGKRIQEVESLLPQGLESTSQRKTPDSVNCQG